MKPETEAKAIIGLIISLIAFGFGSGAGIVMGLSQNDTPNMTQVINSSELPQIPTTKNVDIQTQPQNTSNSEDTTSETVYVDNSGNSNDDSSSGNSNDGSSDSGDSNDDSSDDGGNSNQSAQSIDPSD